MVKILRKVWRLAALFFPILYLFQPKSILLIISGILLAIFAFIEITRFTHPNLNRKLFKNLKHIMKAKEKRHISTITWFTLALFLTLLIFPREIAIIALVFLVFGDSAAEIFGLRFGVTKLIGEKSLQGSLACFLFCLIFGWIFAFILNVGFYIVLIGAIVATIIELVPIKLWNLKIDDNFTVPIISAIIMTLI